MIDVVDRQRLVRVNRREVLDLAAAALAALDRPAAELAVAFVRDSRIRQMNRSFRGKDRATDVLSFPSDTDRAPDEAGHIYLGDVVISTDTALRQAEEAGHSFEREVSELLIHGILHLCGYDHVTDGGEMNRLELKLRRKLLDSGE
ncbi:MAG TPA: rRNA maturation RNase YbeY [Blastocatellia bacterium]|nr:rRNA maturation RNase YbeY [Blastocatellia bacterium]